MDMGSAFGGPCWRGNSYDNGEAIEGRRAESKLGEGPNFETLPSSLAITPERTRRLREEREPDFDLDVSDMLKAIVLSRQ
jgi:hypothetical protein